MGWSCIRVSELSFDARGCGGMPGIFSGKKKPTLFMALKVACIKKTYPVQDQSEYNNQTLFMTKLAGIVTLSMTKTAENHTLWGRTYLYNPYKWVPSGFWWLDLRSTTNSLSEHQSDLICLCTAVNDFILSIQILKLVWEFFQLFSGVLTKQHFLNGFAAEPS